MEAIGSALLRSGKMKRVLNDVRSKAAAYAIRRLGTSRPIRRRLIARGARFRKRKVYKYVKPFKKRVWNKYARPAMKKYALGGKKEYYRRVNKYNPLRYR